MDEPQEIRVDVVNGREFLADEVSISHSPVRFVVDFKSVSPRMDMASQPPRMIIRHNVILLEPHFAKDLLSVLKDNISKYESHFGEIRKPEALQRHEKESARAGSPPKDVRQDYFG
ncbi:DUF3467 domain-containing protein [Candidatus Woesearchaeota archaeon]|nr:DUF3467 domain-containing protein [Candidatus Woesearchaeota archaeon]